MESINVLQESKDLLMQLTLKDTFQTLPTSVKSLVTLVQSPVTLMAL